MIHNYFAKFCLLQIPRSCNLDVGMNHHSSIVYDGLEHSRPFHKHVFATNKKIKTYDPENTYMNVH